MPNPTNVPRGQTNGASLASDGGPSQVRIKQESDQNPPMYQAGSLPPNYGGNNIARERAIQNIQQKFGSEAQPQINRLQAQAAMSAGAGSNAMSGQYSQNSQFTEQQRQNLADYHRKQAQANAARMPAPQQQQPVIGNARTDGADEWDGFVSQRRQASSDPDAVHNADMTLLEQLEQAQRDNEGGGLLLPLSQQTASKSKSRSSKCRGSDRPSQYDGIDDDGDSKADIKDDLFGDDDDADAINSDLDDPDDNVLEEEEDEGRPNQIMLCTYDKVQRVKNKWKCTLKDGVLNTGGRE